MLNNNYIGDLKEHLQFRLLCSSNLPNMK